ncbi:MAG: argininosuccinate lyase [Bacteroidales bacterium]
MPMQLWEKGGKLNKLTGDFTSGKDRDLDLRLAPYDVIGTIAHVRMLEKTGLISKDELFSFETELKKIYIETIEGNFVIEDEVEDVHSQVEIMLTRALGNTGKKIHTARSRNDQVLLDIKLYSREKIKEVVAKSLKLFDTLIKLSDKYKDILMPGYTHMQIAMPSSFGLWFGAYAESLAEDMIILQSAYRIVNQNPLGSAAGYGSSFPVDRQMTTELLGFESMHINAVNAQMNRGKMEKTVAFALGSMGSTLSRMAMDICTFSGQNFGFIILPDEFTTGSSIMPHKKNPDIFELIRARGNKLQSLSNEISLICSNLPSGYHRDYQLIKENFIPAFDILINILEISDTVIDKISVNSNIAENDLYSNLFSVEEVNKLVISGMPFREAYRKIAEKIADGSYRPGIRPDYTHEGSTGNLCNDKIVEKMKSVTDEFNFGIPENAISSLLAQS